MRISDIPWEMVQQELYSWNRPLSLETVRLLEDVYKRQPYLSDRRTRVMPRYPVWYTAMPDICSKMG